MDTDLRCGIRDLSVVRKVTGWIRGCDKVSSVQLCCHPTSQKVCCRVFARLGRESEEVQYSVRYITTS